MFTKHCRSNINIDSLNNIKSELKKNLIIEYKMELKKIMFHIGQCQLKVNYYRCIHKSYCKHCQKIFFVSIDVIKSDFFFYENKNCII